MKEREDTARECCIIHFGKRALGKPSPPHLTCWEMSCISYGIIMPRMCEHCPFSLICFECDPSQLLNNYVL